MTKEELKDRTKKFALAIIKSAEELSNTNAGKTIRNLQSQVRNKTHLRNNTYNIKLCH